MKRIMALVAAFTFLAATAFANNEAPRVGLTLSGGGAKGIAHIGMIQALEEAEIPIDCITGTSMGAIVGSLYAMGYSPAEMMALLASDDFRRWSSGTLDPDELTLLLQPQPTPGWLGVNFGDEGGITTALPTRLINPLPMSWAFMELYAPATRAAGGSFDRLMVPFRCVASDIYTHKPVVFSSGQLAEAVRASMSFPLVFQPIMVGDTLLYDGGLYDVYPVDVMMRDFKPSRLVGIDVSTPNTPPGLNDLMSQIENMVMSGYMPVFPDSIGVNIKFDLERFGLLGWDKGAEIYAIGYRRGRELADSLRSRIPQRRTMAEVESMRRAFKERLHEPEFAPEVKVEGSDAGRNLYIKRLMTLGNRRDMTMNDARRGFYRAVSTGRMRNLVPHALLPEGAPDTDAPDTLLLRADIDKPLKANIGGYLTSSAGSFVYAGLQYYPMRPNVFPSRAAVEGWFGQLLLGGRGRADLLSLHGRFISRFGLDIEAWRKELHQQERMFYSASNPAFLTTSAVTPALFWEMSPETNSVITAKGSYRHLTYRYHAERAGSDGRDHVISDLACISARYVYNTLNDPVFPTAGKEALVSAALNLGRTRLKGYDGRYWRSDRPFGEFEAMFRAWYPLARWLSVGASFHGYWTTAPLLPDYAATMARAKAFSPIASTDYLYDPRFRANQWLAFGLHPVATFGSRFSFRLDGWIYTPGRRILDNADGSPSYSEWFDRGLFIGEASLLMRLPIGGALRVYASYRTSAALRWHAGVALGLPIHI